jgi:hypothetical protein
MSTATISEHQTRVFKALARKQWRTSQEVAKLADVAPRTARFHLNTLVRNGAAEVQELFPSFKYRLAEKAAKTPIAQRIEQALVANLSPVGPPKNPRILTIDIESAPIEAYVWGLWDQNVGIDFVKTDWTILSFAAKWFDEKKVIYADTGGRGADKVRDDYPLLGKIWELLNEADIVVAQNGKRFDVRKINARLIQHAYTPYSPIRVIDTMVEAKRYFAFTSQKLAWTSKLLTDSPKSEHKEFPGFELWTECLKDNPKAWAVMRKYNCQDIRATEKVYEKLRPWIKNHPNVSTYDLKPGGACPNCGSTNVQHVGQATLQSGIYAQYQCLSCGAWPRGKQLLNSTDVRKSKLV